MPGDIQTLLLDGRRYVVLPEDEYHRLVGELPAADAGGTRPAVETMRALLGRDILRDRLRVGLSQAELARKAGVRPETLSRIEEGRQTPGVATVEKIERVLAAAKRRLTSA